MRQSTEHCSPDAHCQQRHVLIGGTPEEREMIGSHRLSQSTASRFYRNIIFTTHHTHTDSHTILFSQGQGHFAHITVGVITNQHLFISVLTLPRFV